MNRPQKTEPPELTPIQASLKHVQESAHAFDPANVPAIRHRWVDRGLKLSCEGATHPNHQVWKARM